MDHLSTEELLDYADDRLAPDRAPVVTAHLAACARCRAELAAFARVTSLLGVDTWVTPPDSARMAVQRAYRQQYGEPSPVQRRPQPVVAWLRGLLASSWQPALALAALLLVAVVYFALREEPATAYAASVNSMTGVVESQAPGSEAWQRANEGQMLQAGTQLRTGADSSLRLAYPDGSSVTLQASAMMTIGEITETPRTIAYALSRGETFNRVASTPDGATRLEITTPTAMVSSGNADFRLVVDDLGSTRVHVDNGAVRVAAAEQSLALSSGQEAVVEAGQPPRLLTVDATPTPSPTSTVDAATPTPQPTATSTPSPTVTTAPPAVTGVPDDDGRGGDDGGGDDSGGDDGVDDGGGDDGGDDGGGDDGGGDDGVDDGGDDDGGDDGGDDGVDDSGGDDGVDDSGGDDGVDDGGGDDGGDDGGNDGVDDSGGDDGVDDGGDDGGR